MQKNVSALRKCFNLSFEEPDIHNPLFNNGTTPLLKCYKSYEYITVYLSLWWCKSNLFAASFHGLAFFLFYWKEETACFSILKNIHKISFGIFATFCYLSFAGHLCQHLREHGHLKQGNTVTPTVNLTIYLDTGLDKHRKLTNMSDLAASLGESYCKTLLGFYVFTGKDCTSSFKGKGN